MESFISIYKDLNKSKLLCRPFNTWIKDIKYAYGSGGSSNLIIIGKLNDKKIVIKLVPHFKKRPIQKKSPNNDIIEIVLYKYFTKKYILKNITPHIVGIYNHRYCSNLKKILPKCPSMKTLLTKKNVKVSTICMFKDKSKRLFEKEYEVVLLEYCHTTIHDEMKKLLKRLINKKINFVIIEDFIYRVCFQIIYTLDCLQKNDKYFTHNDFFLRNILGVNEHIYRDNDYIEYIIHNKSFYLPANGFYSKINDFGYSVIYPKIKPNIVSKDTGPFSWHLWKYNDKKSDIYNFFYDFYDGSNFGATSTMELIKKLKIRSNYKNKIKDIFNKFIKVNQIDKMNSINKYRLWSIWNISKYDFLQKLVRTPKEYLLSNIFKRYIKLPKNGKIIRTFSG